MKTPAWQFDEFQQIGRDYGQAEEADTYESDHTKFRDFDAECEETLQALALDPGASIIDLGAGTGAFSMRASQRGFRVYAVDVSEAMLAHARAKADAASLPNITFAHAGFLTYRHEGPPVDAIVTSFALHHLPDYWKAVALERMREMLRPGGKLFLRDVVLADDGACEHIQRFIDRQDAIGGADLREDAEGHFREEFSTYTWIMDGLLQRAGFAIESQRLDEGLLATYLCRRT